MRILEKAVRVPDKVLGDLQGQVAAIYRGEREYTKLVERYGFEGLESSVEGLLDYTEELTRKSISAMPDGTPECRAMIARIESEGVVLEG